MSGCSEECGDISVDSEDKDEKGVVTPTTTICWPALLPGSAGPSGGVFRMMMSNPEPAESTADGNSSQHSRSGNSLAPIIWQQSDAKTTSVTIVDVEMSKRSRLSLRLISLLQMNKSVIIVSLYLSHFD